MTTIDRYILRLFLKIFIICLLSLQGLYVVVDVFANIEEFIELSKHQAGGMAGLLFEYYFPRALQFFERTCPLLVVMSAVFSLAWLRRTNELTAIQASGTSNMRIARPIMVAAVILFAISALNREWLMPDDKIRFALARNAQSWSRTEPRPMSLQIDPRSGALLRGQVILLDNEMILEPFFQIPTESDLGSIEVRATTATRMPKTDDTPAGFVLADAKVMDASGNTIADFGSILQRNEPLLLSHIDHAWLGDNEVFYVTDLDLIQLIDNGASDEYLSTLGLARRIRQPTVQFANSRRVEIHRRIVQPVIDMSVLLVGMPIVLLRGQKNLFVAAGISLGVYLTVFLAIIACKSLGSSRLIEPAALAAWLPLIMVGPIAFVGYCSLRR